MTPSLSTTLFRRALWVKIHVYLALTLGFLFALMGITGSLCVYREELDGLLNPRLTVENPGTPPLSLDKIMAAVRTAQPSRHDEWVVELPRSPSGVVTAWYEKPHETFGEVYAPLMVSVNPNTAEVVASRFWGSTFATWIEDLHTQLQMGLFGARTVGLRLMASALSGLCLWWPGLACLSRAFTLRRQQGWNRFAHDLHGMSGLGSALILVMLGFTGFHLSNPSILETLADASGMGHGEEGPAIRSTAAPNNRPITLEEAVAIARGPFPHAEVRRIATPAGKDGTYRVNLRRPGEVNIRHPVTLVWVDRWSGQIKAVRNPNLFTAGQTFVSSLWPLHTGEAFGAPGRLLWFFVGFAPLLLYLTGLAQWLIKRGLLDDRAVDFSRLRGLSAGLSKALRKAMPVLKKFLLVAGRWLATLIQNLADWVKRQEWKR